MTPPAEDSATLDLGDLYQDRLDGCCLSPTVLDKLTRLDPVHNVRVIAREYSGIVASASFCHWFCTNTSSVIAAWLMYVLTTMFIGARQHTFAILQHDAAHYRLFPNRLCNNIVAEALLAWPILLSNEWFRKYHFAHHRHVGNAKDGNRQQYSTHTPQGEWKKHWKFPRSSTTDFAAWAIPRLAGFGGMVYFLRFYGRIWRSTSTKYRGAALVYYGCLYNVIQVMQMGQVVVQYWFVPLFTWFIAINILRIVAEHCAVKQDPGSANNFFNHTRTVIPSTFDKIFVVPINVSYHVEHHLYPQVPWYRLLELHEELMKFAVYQEKVHITESYYTVVAKELIVTKGKAA
ncbi:fatty acid desaturase family protein [Seminavis robusta]|uniref:Fatty acid desaturase family protein n=1 Tax=Seminavis robusta TaxID=568900 RepID=A0A9N8D4G9_9STRA|nr:fatty acid desaturase family protein [Seminavis robusta]|eukprot:Sro3_g002520.1 fatty acid desaturase family protein (346) ;mRNA; r:185060-186097